MAKKKQGELPGMEKKHIKTVEDAAHAYVDVRNKRMKLTVKEKEAHDTLLAIMQKNELPIYRDDEAVPPLVVTVMPGKTRVKVEQAGGDEGDE